MIDLAKALERAGRIADGANGNGVPDCEAFYLLLNEIDGGGPTSSGRTPLESGQRACSHPTWRWCAPT